jgi:hypothetical protein
MEYPEDIDMARRDYEAVRAQLLLPAVQARMLADGRDPKAEIARLDALYAEMMRTDALTQNQHDRVLNAMADVADNMRELYRVTKKLLAETEQADPFHPQLKEMRDFLEALSARIPNGDLE